MIRALLEGDFRYALQDLKWLSWQNMNLKMTNLVLKDLVILDLSSADTTDEWLSTIQVYNFVTASSINLSCRSDFF